MEILAIIPARAGSKSIADKNIRSLLAKPLMAYSIEHALNCDRINRVIVSTDSKLYAEIARSYGAEVPFLRPEDISGDLSNDYEFFVHALDWLRTQENYLPDICVQLRPTHPVRKTEDISSMIDLLISRPDADSVRSVVMNRSHIPYKMWFLSQDSVLKPFTEDKLIHEPYNQPRQKLPVTYFQNASVDVIRTKTILEKGSLSGDIILGYVMDEEYDIDCEEDFENVKYRLSERISFNDESIKTFCIDIDGIIANITPGNNYALATPVIENISRINRLFDAGHRIILFTARGTLTGKDWKDLTATQMNEWGVRYHELIFGKPSADFYIDDRNLNISKL
ncbi:MAG: acylneuraminate cytidylyltransferase family protein [Bacteroidia bacterium]|nr:acylneuraminate cytidylyltransferase family protein [Bacteroidia bacterium]